MTTATAKTKTRTTPKPTPIEQAFSRPLPVHNKLGLKFALQMRKRQGALKRLKKPPRRESPKAIEAKYFLLLKKALEEIRDVAARKIVPEIGRIVRLAPRELRTQRRDAVSADVVRLDDFDDEIDRLVDGLRVVTAERIKKDTAQAASGVALETSRAQKNDHQETFERVLGVRPDLAEPWLRPVVDNFVRTNVRAIEDLTETAFDTIERRIGDGVRQGLSADTIAQQLLADLGEGEDSITAKRAAFIASDQVTSFYGDLARVRQQEIGVERYTWRTSRDERVRHSHREREGEVFTWEDIVPQLEAKGLEVDDNDGHPGRPPRCRCYPEPRLEDLIENIE